MNNRTRLGFTLIELLVVVTIIGILSGIVYATFTGSTVKGRDAKRVADLQALQKAIEQYKQKYGRYPTQGCGAVGQWSVSVALQNDIKLVNTAHAGGKGGGRRSGGGATPTPTPPPPPPPPPPLPAFVTCATYVNGLVPEFMNRLPNDPRRGAGLGYAYRTNANGTVYKLMVAGTVEAEAVTASHPFQSCDPTYCGTSCTNSGYYPNSYAVWGGFVLQAPADIYAPDPLQGLTAAQRQTALTPTTDVICRQPG